MIKRIPVDQFTPDRGVIFLREDEFGRVWWVDFLFRLRGRKKRLFLVDYDRAVVHARPEYWLRLTVRWRLPIIKGLGLIEIARGVRAAEGPEPCAASTPIRYYPPTRETR